MAISLNVEQFFNSLNSIYTYWKDTDLQSKIKSAKILTVIFGNNKNDIYAKSSSLHKWLFGYELTDTILIFTKNTLHITSSKKKIDFLQDVTENKENVKFSNTPKIVLHTKLKGDNSDLLSKLSELIKKGKVGVIQKDLKSISNNTDFSSTVTKLLPGSAEQIDISNDICLMMAAKQSTEIGIIKKSCSVTSNIYNKVYKDYIMRTIDKDKKVKHTKISEEIENSTSNTEISGVSSELLETAYPPIIQSGGNYALKFSAQSDENHLHFGIIICMMGMRYKSYCSNIARCLLVNPSDSVIEAYEKLLELYEYLIQIVKPNKTCSEIHSSIIQKCPEKFQNNLTKSFGSIIGIEFKDTALTINSKCQAQIKENMTINLSIGFNNLENKDATDSKAKKFSLFLADTVKITNSDTENIIFTAAAKKRLKSCKISIVDEEAESEDEVKDSILDISDFQKYGRGKRNQEEKSKAQNNVLNEEKRQIKQKQLLEKLNTVAYERLTDGNVNGEEKAKSGKSLISYDNPNKLNWLDEDLKAFRIAIDKKNETVILPISIVPYPIHISMIKNAATSIEGSWEYMRLNFYYPGSTLGRVEGTNFVYPNCSYLKELTFRSSILGSQSQNLQTAVRLIRDLQKRFRAKEQEEKERKGLVKQDKLVINANFRGARLKDMYMRPNLGQRRIPGVLEAHTNGFRYQNVRQDKMDILYNNIKHAIFQPCDHEMIMVLHFKLKNFILMNKKKVQDIQFYIEVGEITTDLMKGTNIRDRDDLYAEQREREMRNKLKAGFKNFIDRVENISKDVDFDTPFRDLGFHGVPHRSSCLLQPTSGCLINVTEWPSFVVGLDEIECIHFERVGFGIKNFDMVIIFKDYTRKIANITSIPMKKLEDIKSWLNSCDIRYSEGLQSLNWLQIMKTIVDDIEGFFQTGGWSFLDTETRDSDESEDSTEDDEYGKDKSSNSESTEASESDDYSSEATDDFSEDSASSGSGEESAGSEGKDWDQLEDEARRADKNKGEYSEEEEEEERPRKGKTKTKSSKNGPPSKKHKRR